jgi:hypothetical protein
VAREASARYGALGAGWKRNSNDNQRNRGETLHEDILRLFAHCVLAKKTTRRFVDCARRENQELSRCSKDQAMNMGTFTGSQKHFLEFSQGQALILRLGTDGANSRAAWQGPLESS